MIEIYPECNLPWNRPKREKNVCPKCHWLSGRVKTEKAKVRAHRQPPTDPFADAAVISPAERAKAVSAILLIKPKGNEDVRKGNGKAGLPRARGI